MLEIRVGGVGAQPGEFASRRRKQAISDCGEIAIRPYDVREIVESAIYKFSGVSQNSFILTGFNKGVNLYCAT
ncbi:hypothetical protein D3C71_1981480 [compost metagenome]